MLWIRHGMVVSKSNIQYPISHLSLIQSRYPTCPEPFHISIPLSHLTLSLPLSQTHLPHKHPPIYPLPQPAPNPKSPHPLPFHPSPPSSFLPSHLSLSQRRLLLRQRPYHFLDPLSILYYEPCLLIVPFLSSYLSASQIHRSHKHHPPSAPTAHSLRA